MGNYRIVVEGIGAHHNGPESAGDADRIGRDLVETLRAHGHTLSRAQLEVESSDGTRVEELTQTPAGRAIFAEAPNYPRRSQAWPILRFFDYEHLPPQLMVVSRPFAELARRIAGGSTVWPAETATALRKLLEAKDAAVRAALPVEG